MNYKAKMSQVKGALTGFLLLQKRYSAKGVIADMRAWTGIYQQGRHRTCIYKWKIGTEGNRDE